MLPGLHASSSINKLGYKEFLFYVTPNGEKQSTIIQSTGNGKALIEKMIFDCCEIENVEFDFDNNLCSFQSHAKVDDNIHLLLKNILSSFLIQYHPESIAFFTYRKPKMK